MADTARAIALRPGKNGWRDRNGEPDCWIRLTHDCESPPAHGHITPKPAMWNVPGGEHRHHEWPLSKTADREGHEEGGKGLESFQLLEDIYPGTDSEIAFEGHLRGHQDNPRTELGFWTKRVKDHRIAAFLLVEKNPVAIQNDPENPPKPEELDVKDENGRIECDMAGWFHVRHLPDDLFYTARLIILGSLRELFKKEKFAELFRS